MHPMILFRGSLTEEEELIAAKKYFHVEEQRTNIPDSSLVIARYSALPFYKELEEDVKNCGSKLINTYKQHCYVADIRNYYNDIKEFTPPIYEEYYNLPEGSYVVKGNTNSRKHQWNRQMFAKTKNDIQYIVNSLLDDELIRQQGLVVRPYIPLKKLGEGINGLPISNEWRLFFLDGWLVKGGYYWSSEADTCPTKDPMNIPDAAYTIAHKALEKINNKIRFVVIDVAETANGDWIVIELNDGQQSGLSMIYPDAFYFNLYSFGNNFWDR